MQVCLRGASSKKVVQIIAECVHFVQTDNHIPRKFWCIPIIVYFSTALMVQSIIFVLKYEQHDAEQVKTT